MSTTPAADPPARRPPPDPEPPGTSRVRLDEQLLMAAVAQRYYFDQQSKVEIAKEFSISRFKVSRLLAAATQSGLVRIEIELPHAVDADLSMRLRERFALERAVVVVPPDSSDSSLRDTLGRAAASLLSDVVSTEDVLGVTSGRTMDAVARHLTRLPGCEVIQLTGMSGDLDDNPVDVLRRVAELAGGGARSIYAPLTVSSAAAAEALRSHPAIADTFARFGSVTVAVTSIGSLQPPDSRLHDALSAAQQELLRGEDAAADLAGAILNSAGEVVHVVDDCILGITAEELRAVPQVVVVGGGIRKAKAVLAALRSGLVTTLVTDDTVAATLLAEVSG